MTLQTQVKAKKPPIIPLVAVAVDNVDPYARIVSLLRLPIQRIVQALRRVYDRTHP